MPERADGEAGRWKQQLDRVIDAIPDAVLIVDREGRFEFANRGAERVLGISREEILGRSFKEKIWRPTAMDGSPLPPDTLPYAQVLRSRRPLRDFQFRIETPQGQSVIVSAGAEPLQDERGEIVAVVTTLVDVTAQVKAQEALRESEERFRLLVDRAADAMFLHDLEGKILDVNAQTARSLGYSREELLRLGVADIEVGFDPDRLARIWEQLLKTGPETFYGVHRRKDGSTFPVEVRVGPFASNGRQLILALARDISERQEAERRVAESEERYRSLVEASPDAIVVYREGRVVFANPAAVRLLEASTQEELIGRPVLDFVHPDSRDLIVKRMRRIQQERRPLPSVEEKYVTLRGNTVHVELAAIPFVWEGKPAVQVVVRDITERARAEEARRASEERYRLLFESNPLPMWVYDVETLRFLAVNQAAIEHYGYPKDEFLRMTIKDIRTPPEISGPSAAAEEARTADTFDRISRHRKKDGGLIDVRITSYDIPFEGRLGRLVVAEDITELKRAEEELKEKDRAIRRAYVDVIGAVTGNRLVLMTDDEIAEALGTPLTPRHSVRKYKELSEARRIVRKVLEAQFPNVKTLDEFIVAFCEGLTNAVKHAGGGEYQVFKLGKTAQVVIADKGPGIDFRNLPKATLVPGFSTGQTLGMGFTIMLDVSDRLLLSTHPGGTTLVLETSK